MAFTYGFYNSLNGDRKYDARHISAIFDGIINDGVYASIPNLYAVRPGAGMQVLVGSGRAWFNHTWNDNDADFPINIPAADPLLYRYYAICLEVNSDEAVRANRLMSIQGTLGSQAAVTKPVLTKSETINQWALAYVLVPPGVVQITTSMIEVVVGMAETPFVTGIIETASIDALFQQWDGDFNAWWDNIKATLDENIVTNLQNQINDRVKISDKATVQEAVAGTNNTKWMTPATTLATIEGNRETEIGDIKVSGRNLEIETNGTFLTCDGRSLMINAYPTLYEKIRRRFGFTMPPAKSGSVASSSTSYQYGINLYVKKPDGGIIATFSGINLTGWVSVFNSAMGRMGVANTMLHAQHKALFYVGATCYLFVYGGGGAGPYTAQLLTVNETTGALAGVWSSGGVYHVHSICGFTIIDGKGYLAIDISMQSGAHTISIFTISGTSVSKMDLYTNVAAAAVDYPVLLGRTLYIGGTTQKQTDVQSVSLTDLTNPVVKTFLNLKVPPRATNKKGNVIAAINTGSALIYTLTENEDLSISMKTYPIIMQTAAASTSSYPASVMIDNDGKPYVITGPSSLSNTSVAMAFGVAVDDSIMVFNSIAATANYPYSGSEFLVCDGYHFVWSNTVYSTNYTGTIYSSTIDESTFLLPARAAMSPAPGANMFFIKATE